MSSIRESMTMNGQDTLLPEQLGQVIRKQGEQAFFRNKGGKLNHTQLGYTARLVVWTSAKLYWPFCELCQ